MGAAKRTLLAVGKIVKAFGVRGDIAILPMTDNPGRFKKLKRVFVGRNDTDVHETAAVAAVVDTRGVRLRLAGVNTRTDAEKLVGALLFVDEQDAAPLAKGSYYVHTIIGLRVVDDAGTTLGVVKDVLKYPAHDVYVVEHNGGEVMIPAVKEFIKKIDIGKGTMRVKLIEGMLNGSAEEARDHDAD